MCGSFAMQCTLCWRLHGVCCRLQEALDAANKAAEEVQEQLQQAQQAAADEASKAAEVHAVEVQKLLVERTKLEVSEG